MHARLDYVFEFLEDLSRNNTRSWMHTRANERRFDVVQRTMRQWIAMLLLDMQDIEDTHGLRPKDCQYRIWRDTRFSANKTPCKTYMSFLIRTGGRRNDARAGYYVQIGPKGQSFVGGGVWAPEPDQLKKIRAAIFKRGEGLSMVLKSAAFRKTFGELEPMRLKTMPRDYRTADVQPDIRELLRYTSWVAGAELPDKDVLSADFDAKLVGLFRTLKPLNDWLNSAVSV